MIIMIYDYEIYDHSNFFSVIWHMSFVDKSMLVDHNISRFETQGLRVMSG